MVNFLYVYGLFIVPILWKACLSHFLIFSYYLFSYLLVEILYILWKLILCQLYMMQMLFSSLWLIFFLFWWYILLNRSSWCKWSWIYHLNFFELHACMSHLRNTFLSWGYKHVLLYFVLNIFILPFAFRFIIYLRFVFVYRISLWCNFIFFLMDSQFSKN